MMAFSHYDVALLARALWMTVVLSVAGGLAGLAGGTALACLRMARGPVFAPARFLAAGYVQVVRRVPFIVTLYIVFFLTGVAGLDVSERTVAIWAIGMIATGYIAEIVHGGLRSVPTDQVEAAVTLNLPLLARWRHVIVPQALPVIVPPAVGYLVLFIKDTALASQVGVLELNQAGVILSNRGLPTIQVFLAVLGLYFALSYPLTRLSRMLEKRLALS
ncbi:polar amino acid ABC transporter, inner membrane subunit [Gluconacetobacter diazotrophicus PA1 5]|uniref:Amino acid ABC transporter permease n=1 Tax=Gluconacetobacter diazotrophicus TaxID=33996 RepID=A0A7W4I835_GLUDI|nr:amino acid ABC transporter permease [Gluconacetobacter diazotrophicus]ACI50709.1 polar amino acid ABC transporter, inner membrane subunit [Gluconacetobacter diazotrophicus PA1 5]MBB2157954.1 amino acid ABC transporter permease [Gluconacetobacter diazotrophicus]